MNTSNWKKMLPEVQKAALLAALLFFLGAGISAHADTITFDFNSLSSGNNSGQIATYMDGKLGCINCVTVTGAVADKTYTGDNHVVGPGTGSHAGKKSLTLGNTDGATASNANSVLNSSLDTFLANTSDKSSQISSEIVMQFSGLFITGISFDYEIFPDGSCTSLSKSGCGGTSSGGIYPHQPDFEFKADGSLVTAFGTNGVQYGVAPGTAPIGSTHSPNSGTGHAELAPQYIGTFSGGLGGVTQLEFIDWPATIGIDNLQITYRRPPPPVPEPSSILLLGSGLLASLTLLRRKLRNLQ